MGCQPPAKQSNPFFRDPKSGGNPAILNGHKVVELKGIAQHTAALFVQRGTNVEVCSATLLSERMLLTAGHCVGAVGDLPAPSIRQVSVAFGSDAGKVFRENEKARLRPVRSLRLHPQYSSECALQAEPCPDLALVEFAGGIPPGFSPILWQETLAADFAELKSLQIAGFGQTSFQDPLAVSLYEGTAQVAALVESSAIAIDQTAQTAGICNGDSGGPGFHKNSLGQIQLLSVHSRVIHSSRNRGRCQNRGLLLRLDAHLAWLRSSLTVSE